MNEWHGSVQASFFGDKTFFAESGERFVFLWYTSTEVLSFLVFLFFLTGETPSSLLPAQSMSHHHRVTIHNEIHSGFVQCADSPSCGAMLGPITIRSSVMPEDAAAPYSIKHPFCRNASTVNTMLSSYLNRRMFPSERSWAVRNCAQSSPSSKPDWSRASSTCQNLPTGLKTMAFCVLDQIPVRCSCTDLSGILWRNVANKRKSGRCSRIK